MSFLSINYAKGISERLGMKGRVYFCVTSAQEMADKLQSYPGKVELGKFQFTCAGLMMFYIDQFSL